jgi:hypothetical protein
VGSLAAENPHDGGIGCLPSTLVELACPWRLDSTGTGRICSASLTGYVLVVPLVVGMTDRIDSRVVYLAGSV